MRRQALALTAALTLTALAGCITAPEVPDPLDPGAMPDLASVFEMEHDHADPAAHATSWNAEMVAHLAPAIEGLDHASLGEVDVWGDYAFAIVLGAKGGFMVFDVADPAAPEFLHFEPAPEDASCPGDVKAGPTDGLLVLATQCGLGGATRLPWPGSMTQGRGFVVYDVTDPAAPKVVSKAPQGTSCHMADTAAVGSDLYVYCATIEGPVAWKLVDLPTGPKTPVLVNPNLNTDPTTMRNYPLAASEFGPTTGAFFMTYAHDMTTQADPLTGEPIVIVSHSYNGVRILDGKDPQTGRVLGQWSGEGAEFFSWIHTAMAVEMDGKRIVVAITENVVDTPPRMWILDWTDYANPVVLSEYALADQESSHELVFSLHNFQVVDRKVYMAAYHAGVWVIDIGDPAAPKPVGFALPNGESPYKPAEGTFYGIGNDWITQAWDVVVKDGYVLVGDMRSGFYVYKFAMDPAGDAEYDSFG